jgi:hypothetical protein
MIITINPVEAIAFGAATLTAESAPPVTAKLD